MAAPNKLLMGLASILGAYHGNKRRKREALNDILFKAGYSPGQEAEYMDTMRKLTERRAGGGTIGEQDMTDLFGQMRLRLEGLSQYSKDILADPANYYPANFKKGSTSASKSQEAMQELQDSIVMGLIKSPQRFTLEEATLQAENLAPIFARQAFGPGSDERKLSGIDLMQKSDIMGAISE